LSTVDYCIDLRGCVSCKQCYLNLLLINGRVHRYDAEAGEYPHFEKR
jgi:hypothetical protein